MGHIINHRLFSCYLTLARVLLVVNWGETKAWHFALVVNDIAEHEVTLARSAPDGDITFKLEMTSTAGLSYQGDWYRLSAEVDLTDRSNLLQLAAPKYAAIGAEVNWGEHAQLIPIPIINCSFLTVKKNDNSVIHFLCRMTTHVNKYLVLIHFPSLIN